MIIFMMFETENNLIEMKRIISIHSLFTLCFVRLCNADTGEPFEVCSRWIKNL